VRKLTRIHLARHASTTHLIFQFASTLPLLLLFDLPREEKQSEARRRSSVDGRRSGLKEPLLHHNK
jgi:hypothetical protein